MVAGYLNHLDPRRRESLPRLDLLAPERLGALGRDEDPDRPVDAWRVVAPAQDDVAAEGLVRVAQLAVVDLVVDPALPPCLSCHLPPAHRRGADTVEGGD